MTSSARFHLAEFTAFIEISESTFALPFFFLKVTLLPTFTFLSLILSIIIFDRIVPFRVLDRYTTSLLPSCCVGFMGELTSFAQSTFAFIQFIEDLSYQWSVETCFQHRLGPVALNFRPDLFHEGNSVHITPRFILVVSLVNSPLFFLQCSQEKYSGSALYSSPPRRLHQKFCFDCFQLTRRAALRQISAYIHAG